jgi:hypothetical protein
MTDRQAMRHFNELSHCVSNRSIVVGDTLAVAFDCICDDGQPPKSVCIC